MALYPETLFHFTNKNNLYSILKSSFKVSYARERIFGGNVLKAFGVPMVSFSDLRLSELKVNLGTYGKYGIGMTKEWAISNGLNPVFYVSRNSNFTESFFEGIENHFQMVTDSTDGTGNIEAGYNKIMNTMRYMKNYKGDLIRPGIKTKPNHVFANEKEWRFVPEFNENFFSFVNLEKLWTTEKKNELNRSVENIRLQFKPDDIKYLIVENDKDINQLISHLRKVKNLFSDDELDRLASRILTYDQIESDI